jgi:hypothetical protein
MGRRESVLTSTHQPGPFSRYRATRTALRARVGVFSMILFGIGYTLATQGEYTPTTTTRFKFLYSPWSCHHPEYPGPHHCTTTNADPVTYFPAFSTNQRRWHFSHCQPSVASWGTFRTDWVVDSVFTFRFPLAPYHVSHPDRTDEDGATGLTYTEQTSNTNLNSSKASEISKDAMRAPS